MSQQWFFSQGWSFQVGWPIAEKPRHDCPHKKLATFDHNVVVWNMAFIFHEIYGMSSETRWRIPSFFKMGALHHQAVITWCFGALNRPIYVKGWLWRSQNYRGSSPRQARRKAQNGAESEEEAPSQVSTGSGQIGLIYEHLVLEMGNWLVVWNRFVIFSLGIRIPSDFHIFQRGRSTTNQGNNPLSEPKGTTIPNTSWQL